VSEVKVSIICTTFNQVNFIRQALDGIIMQKTHFPFEALVYDDASTDGTADIVREYAEKYPDIIRPILQTENQFSRGVDVAKTFIWPCIRGKYVAICDGDDYWTNDKKLQLQADYLDRHPECAICFHRVRMFYQDGSKKDRIVPKNPGPMTLSGLVYKHHIPNVAVMYRWRRDMPMPSNIMPCDWYVHLLHAQSGDVGFIPYVMAAYRRQANGIWFATTSNDDALHLRWGMQEMNFWQNIEKNIAPNPTKYHRFVCDRAAEIFGTYARHHRYDDAIAVMKMCPDLIQPIDHSATHRWRKRFKSLLNGVIITVAITILVITGVVLL